MATFSVLPVRRVLFPMQVATYAIGKNSSVALIERLLDALGQPFGPLDDLARSSSSALLAVSLAKPDDEFPIHHIGTAVRLLEVRAVTHVSGGGGGGAAVYVIVVQGVERLAFDPAAVQEAPYLRLTARRCEPGPALDRESSTAFGLALQGLAQEVLRGLQFGPALVTKDAAADKGGSASLLAVVGRSGGRMDSSTLALLVDGLAAAADASASEKQAVLEAPSVGERAELVVAMLKRHVEVLRLSQRLSSVRGELSRSHHEAWLRRQLKVIRGELNDASGLRHGAHDRERGGGEGPPQADAAADGGAEKDEVAELQAKLLEAKLPDAARVVAERELRRLRQMQPMHAEYAVLLNYLEWLAAMPWAKTSDDSPDDAMPSHLDLERAQALLDAEHFGLASVKRRVYEHLAVLTLRRDTRGPILCLVGPPGVGKTSLGRSIAAALGRSFERISLGGMSDAADIRGHRRTYVGAMPGLIVQALRRAGSANPVLMLDEIEKLGRDGRSDPAAALLEVLDPSQNGAFTDHYLNLPVDLSKVLFVATANSVDHLPPALLDRMEVLEMSGYTLEEKLHIAEHHLLPRQTRQSGLPDGFVHLHKSTLVALTEGYTREAGLRNLEREIASLCRAVAVKYAKLPRGAERESAQPTAVAPSDLAALIGPRRYEKESREQLSRPGVALGLAWTPAGGELLYIETSRMGGSGQLILTGQLGEVMQESVHTALSYIRSHAADLGLEHPPLEAPPSTAPARYGEAARGGALNGYGGGYAQHGGKSLDDEDCRVPAGLTALAALPPPTAPPGAAAAAAAAHYAVPPPPSSLAVSAATSAAALSQAAGPSQGVTRGHSLLAGIDVHVHFPAGATRKDGPSAGAATLVALASLFSGRLARSDTAMSGEISLRGHVMPVGGVREKVLAAHRAGVQRVLLPRLNQKDVHGIAPSVREELAFVWCSTVEELLAEALQAPPQPSAPRPPTPSRPDVAPQQAAACLASKL